jgi:HEAT repeat protein
MSRLHLARAGVAAALTLGAAHPGGAQSLAERVAAAGEGEVRMSYATRANVCGDGRNTVGVGDSFMMSSSTESYGRWSSRSCVPGPARVALQVGRDGVESIRTSVGGSWGSSSGRVVDLGVVPSAAAASYFLDLAEKLDARSVRNTLLPAVIADSADINPRLLSIAQQKSLSSETRRRAVSWLGLLGDASLVRPLTELAKASDDERRSVGEAALFALSRLPDGAGIPSLIDLARGAPSSRTRGQAVFWLGQSDDTRGRQEVRTIAGDANAPAEVREKAVFALGHGDAATSDDLRFLRELFGRADSPKIRDQILMAMSQSDDPEARKWLLSVARDESAPVESRKKAIFWAGQGGVSTAEIAAIYDASSNIAVKEHTIFVLSQRDDKAATEKLLAIVNGHDDGSLRKKALFWLGQKNDPAAAKAISDLVTRP